jgi:Phage integrase, N-terminal SAM-like domain
MPFQPDRAGHAQRAEAALAALVTEVTTGAGGHSGTDATVGELVEQGLDLKRDTLSVTTWEGYVGKARVRLIPALGKVPVRKLTVRDIDAFYRALARDEQLAASTIRQIHNVVTGSLAQAVRWGWRSETFDRHSNAAHADCPVIAHRLPDGRTERQGARSGQTSTD